MSTLAKWCRVVQSRDVRSRVFSRPPPPRTTIAKCASWCRADMRGSVKRVSVKRAGQLSLPHVGITNTERNRTKTFNSMISSYNTPCSKHKLVVSIYSNTEASFVISTIAIWCRVVRSLDFSAPQS